MIPVVELEDGTFERIGGNPVLTSLDGEVKAPLATILADTWTDEDRAKFGVYPAVPFVEPEGHQRIGEPDYVRQPDGTIKEDYFTKPIPEPKVLTVDEKLALIGLTIPELKAALA